MPEDIGTSCKLSSDQQFNPFLIIHNLATVANYKESNA
jgi:hypothetical protein